MVLISKEMMIKAIKTKRNKKLKKLKSQNRGYQLI